MNNWSLLLLALVAVFHPIDSFTEHNLVDGRQQCCGRETDPFHRVSRTSLYGTYRIEKDSPSFRRLIDQDEIRETRRSKLTQRDTVLVRRSTDRSLPDFRERDSGRSPSMIRASTRLGYRTERVTDNENRDRRLDVQERFRNARNIRAINSEEGNRRFSKYGTRYSTMLHVARTAELTSHKTLARDIRLTNGFNKGYQTRDSHSQNERIQATLGNLRKLAPTRETRDNLRQMREDAIRIVGSIDNRRHITRERTNTGMRTSIFRDGVRHHLKNREYPKQVQVVEHRRSLPKDAVVRGNEIHMKVNSRQERQETHRNHVNNNQRLMFKRIEGQYRGHIRENTESRFTEQKMQMDRRNMRYYRRNGNHIPSNRVIERKHSESSVHRLVRNNRVDWRGSRRSLSAERTSHVLLDRRARSAEIRRFRDVNGENESKLQRSTEVSRGRGDPRILGQIGYGNKLENRDRETTNRRARDAELPRNREMIITKIVKENEATTHNWPYIFYTLQGAYLCGLFMQLLTPNRSEKSHMTNLRWWASFAQKDIKVD